MSCSISLTRSAFTVRRCLAPDLVVPSQASCRAYSAPSSSSKPLISRRAMLYVPGSNPRMLAKSLDSPADSVCYDLEDSVAPGAKPDARRAIADFLEGDKRPLGEVMVRVNSLDTEWAQADVDEVLRTRHISALALPKTTSPSHLSYLASRIEALCPPEKHASGHSPIRIIGMIEGARAMCAVEDIARQGVDEGYLDGLLFAAEDYCADVGITRTEDRLELLYPRSRLVTAAKACGLQAIDLVCVDYKDPEALRRECEEGARLGFTGKASCAPSPALTPQFFLQAIHPAQVEIIHSAYSPSARAIRHAARVRFSFELNDRQGKGSYSLDGKMIDAPVYKQVQLGLTKQALKVLARAEAAGLEVPEITEADIKP